MAEDACRHCGQPVRVQIFRGTGFCSIRCEKAERERAKKP